MKILALFFSLFLALQSWAQDLLPFVCINEGAELLQVNYDAKGKEISRSTIVVNQFLKGSDYENFTLVETHTDKDTSVVITSTVKDGVIEVDVPTPEGMDIDLSQFADLPPYNIYVGQKLRTGSFNINLGQEEGVDISININVTKNEVIDQQSITVPAGTFDCYVIEKIMTIKFFLFKETIFSREWTARGIGTVKEEFYDKRGKKLENYTVLESIKY